MCQSIRNSSFANLDVKQLCIVHGCFHILNICISQRLTSCYKFSSKVNYLFLLFCIIEEGKVRKKSENRVVKYSMPSFICLIIVLVLLSK